MNAAQRTAWLLGIAGLVPFYALLGVVAIQDGASWVTPAFVGYAAVILSFLGGIAWGRALQSAAGREFRLSVVPSLFAWLALLLPEVLGVWAAEAGRAAKPPARTGFPPLLGP